MALRPTNENGMNLRAFVCPILATGSGFPPPLPFPPPHPPFIFILVHEIIRQLGTVVARLAHDTVHRSDILAHCVLSYE